jgi:hypothetical protein
MQQFNFRRILKKCAEPMLADFFEHHRAFEHGIDREWLENPATGIKDLVIAYHRLP